MTHSDSEISCKKTMERNSCLNGGMQFQGDILTCFADKNEPVSENSGKDLVYRNHAQSSAFRFSEYENTPRSSLRECRFAKNSEEKLSPRRKYKQTYSCRYGRRSISSDACNGNQNMSSSSVGNYYATVNYKQIPQSDLQNFFKQSCFNS